MRGGSRAPRRSALLSLLLELLARSLRVGRHALASDALVVLSARPVEASPLGDEPRHARLLAIDLGKELLHVRLCGGEDVGWKLPRRDLAREWLEFLGAISQAFPGVVT